MKIGTPVEFPIQDEVVRGHLYKTGTLRNRAQVIDSSNKIWRVPDTFLKEIPGESRNTFVTPIDLARSRFRVGDLVNFSKDGILYSGKVFKLNKVRAIVMLGDGDKWTVPYFNLKLVTTPNPLRPGENRLQTISDKARALMDSHGLKEWHMRFDESIRFLGRCNFRDKVIFISRSHALDGEDKDVIDTILHEIAHALAGPKARHGPEWKKIARKIGATPRACFKPTH